jgi:hypothetical protein
MVAEAIVVVVVNLVVDGITVAVVDFAVILVDIGNVVVVGGLKAFPVVLALHCGMSHQSHELVV